MCGFLWCPIISSIMTRNSFEHIIQCLHVHNNHGTIIDRINVKFDKLVKLRWLLYESSDRYNDMWNLGDNMIIDEIMIQYKIKYCVVRQYMPKNQLNGELKFDIIRIQKRCMWTFEVYCGANKGVPEIKCSKRGEAMQGVYVLYELLRGLEIEAI